MDERKRILDMEDYPPLSICPSCQSKVIPKRRYYPCIPETNCRHYSNLLWCPKCLKGKAGIFWEIYDEGEL